MKIKTRIWVIVFLCIILAITIGLLVIMSIHETSITNREAKVAAILVKDIAELNIVTHEYLLHFGERSLIQWKSKYDSLLNLLWKHENKFDTTDENIAIKQIHENLVRFGTSFDKLATALVKKNNKQKDPISPEQQDRLIGELLIKSQATISPIFHLQRIIQDEMNAAQKKFNLIIFACLGGIVSLIVGTLFWIDRSIAKPIIMLEKGIQIIGTGNLNHKVGTEVKDEIGSLSRSFNKMTKDLKNTTTSIDDLNNEIVERKQAEESLQKLHDELDRRVKDRTLALETANAELSQYAHVVSHDLKAPLRAIHNYSDFLREDLEGILDGDQREYLDGLNRAVNQGEELVNDLLTLSRIDRSGDAYEAIDMEVFIQELESALNLPDNVELSLSDDLPVVKTDKILLSRIFQNLIDNAIKFNDSQIKRIRIGRSDMGEGNLELFVHDNGIGIAPRFIAKIFQGFQRLHTSKEYEGTGIGLAIVKKAADKLGGKVRVESEPGKGSTFFINIPQKAKE